MNNYRNSLIYVVDDGQQEHYLLKLILADQPENCNVRFFSDGTQLLTQLTHRLDNRLPDLILLNLQLSILTGYEVLLLLKRDTAWKSIPIIAYNASAKTVDSIHYTDLDCTAFLDKYNGHRKSARRLSANYLNVNLTYSDN
ncbi:response regulator [Spirosoma sp. KCTC 42546]|uniref:response regulator n=1 Tax=Spirosoma sp. KCTC 42546 TaxID=2520506 RepID=UPI00115B7217|nr:response regulator [Spirosoma sp. KCTC 42546]QDK81612.1 response regulator [Spirosoma sp. KCTC 42546]